MRTEEVLRLLDEGAQANELESETLEFKQEDPSSLKRTFTILADAVVCFANSNGGQIILGVTDKGTGSDAVLGVSDALNVDLVVRGIFDRTTPAMSVLSEEVEHNGKRLLVLTVPKGATLYANHQGTAARRVGRECRPFPPEEQKQALASRGLYDWSAQPSPAGVDELNPEELLRLRRLLLAAGRDTFARADNERLLRDLRVVTEDGAVTWAGLLLLGTPDALREHAPRYGYAYQYRRSPGSESVARLRAQRPILAAIDEVLAAVETRRSVHSLNVSGGVQLQLYDYPTAAVRELAVNAFVHRDYETAGTVEVDHSPERLVISSPGALVYGVTPSNILTHPSTPRNQLLLEVVTTLQVAERSGQGVDRAYREMLRVGKPPPTYEDFDTRVEATLTGGAGNDAFVRYLSTELPDDLAGDIDVLLTLELLRTRQSVTAELTSPRVQRSVDQAQRVLAVLAERGIVEPSRRTMRQAYPRYSLTSDALTSLGRSVSYHRARGNTRDQKVVEHVQEYGHITNQSLRRLFDVTVYQARDMLRDLQKRGILTKLDERSGGRGIRYGPGPDIDSVVGGEGAGRGE